MDNIETFLESSSIHGLGYISTTKKYVRLFWILVIVTGFLTAGVLINTSFKTWNESPIKTTLETRAIKEITFPKVIVCPPVDSNTNLNYDLMTNENRTLGKETRDNLAIQAHDLLQEHMFNAILENLRKMEVKDRYYNWYHGFDRIYVPGQYSVFDYYSIVESGAKSGSYSLNILETGLTEKRLNSVFIAKFIFFYP